MTLAGKIFVLLIFCSPVISQASVIITKGNTSLFFEAADASFSPHAPNSGLYGMVILGNPKNACTPLENATLNLTDIYIALVIRGDCSFERKVRYAQDAGFDAVIVADNEENDELLTMSGDKSGISIPAVFISKIAGDVLSQYSNDSDAECWIFPSYRDLAWLIMLISFVFLLVVTAIFAICFVVRQRSRYPQNRRGKATNVVSDQFIKSLPMIVYTCTEGNQATESCAICLEEYVDGVQLRVLPCRHRFHCSCIDAWLLNWQGVCPLCKQNVAELSLPTEQTPLLHSPGVNGQTYLRQETQTDTNVSTVSRNESCQFSFSTLPPRSRAAPIQTNQPSRHSSLRHMNTQLLSRGVNNDCSIEAFRASPYFTPPSFLHNSAPNVLLPLDSSCALSYLTTNDSVSPSESPMLSASHSTGRLHLV